ncbi:MAG: hypothetical protein JNL01_11280 [Bdellovibrionales bacterium]|nr:hypothetical protein [Bdellovibrionales bacterium]
MKTRGSMVRALLAEESGQALTEYILILAFCAIGAATLTRKLMGFFDEGILKLAAQMEKDLKSGRSPLDSWSN